MQRLLQDVFRDTIKKARELGVWERLTIRQKEALVSKSLLHHFKNARSPVQRETREPEPAAFR